MVEATRTDQMDEWQVELQPALAQLAGHLRHRPRSERPVYVPMGDDQFEVTPAEVELILKRFAGSTALSRHLVLVCDSICWRAKAIEDEDLFTKSAKEEHAEAAAVLRRDISLGHRLMHSMQGEMGALMAGGRVEEARRLADHRGRVSDTLQRLSRTGGDEVKTQPEATPRRQRRSGRRKRTRSETDRYRVLIGRAVVGGLVLVLAVLLIRLYANRVRDLAPVSVADLSRVPGVERVVSRSPEVIVFVSGEVWMKLDAAARRQAAESAVLTVQRFGYRRLEFRSGARSSLVVWRKGQEIQVAK